MGWFTFNLKRLAVMCLAVALIVISVIALATQSWSAGYIVLYIVVIVASVFGFFGALMEHPRWLQIFLFMLLVLIIWELVVIIYNAVEHSDVLWTHIAAICILGICAAFTVDIIRTSTFLTSSPAYVV